MYGVNSAPFPALRCLHKIDCNDGANFPRAKGLLFYNTYVDDIIAGTDRLENRLAIQRHLVCSLQRSEFELIK